MDLVEERSKLNEKILNGLLTEDDLSKAGEIARKLGSIEDRVIYSAIKAKLANDEQHEN
ncbi:MAG: hypothetical protein ACE3JK_01490 [Sporolactobacillus sp.]